ncbi:hypothetical protein MHK_008945 [Candidatus Magnetomorum sp. HK-1]|nr:hypothetical protein MHK_008945 [Candidatus Magnetomorum sp. HK-1]
MTIVAGFRLPQGVMLCADSRAITINNGIIEDYRDDFQKVFTVKPFIVGISGNATLGIMVIELIKLFFVEKEEFISSLNSEELIPLFEKLIKDFYFLVSEDLNIIDDVIFMYATLTKHQKIDAEKPINMSCNSSLDVIKVTSNLNRHCNSVLKIYSLPNNIIEEIDCGNYSLIGSGKIFQYSIRNISTYITDSLIGFNYSNMKNDVRLIDELPNNSIIEIWGSVASRIKSFFVENNDETFNEILHGCCIDSDGYFFTNYIEGHRNISRKKRKSKEFKTNNLMSDICSIDDLNSVTNPGLTQVILQNYCSTNQNAGSNKLFNLFKEKNGRINFLGLSYCNDKFIVYDLYNNNYFKLSSKIDMVSIDSKFSL